MLSMFFLSVFLQVFLGFVGLASFCGMIRPPSGSLFKKLKLGFHYRVPGVSHPLEVFT